MARSALEALTQRLRPEKPISPEIPRDFKRVFIANRGEIGLRILQACQNMGIGAVVGYSDADENSLAVRVARKLAATDERYAVARLGSSNPNNSYGNAQRVLDSTLAYGCDAVHPGYGFLSENAEAAELFADPKWGIRFIGPSPDAIKQLGTKSEAKKLAAAHHIPIIPGSGVLQDVRGNNRTMSYAKRAAARIGYPVITKPSDSGGGNGIKVIRNEQQLAEILPNVQEQFGDTYLERYIEKARHIEIQIAVDKYGNVAVLGERDCSAQRKFQKFVEESPPQTIPEGMLIKIRQNAVTLAKEGGYENLCTVEFLVDETDPNNLHEYFIEANTRIQVEHTVTEERIGQDLVELQMRIARGERLPEIHQNDEHVIQLRLYAEKPREKFAADSGKIHHLKIPQGEGVRFDQGYEEGDTIPEEYDKTIGKLIVKGKNRADAIAKAAAALHEFEATGVSTNKDFLLWFLSLPEFVNNTIYTTSTEAAWERQLRARLGDTKEFLAHPDDFDERTKPRSLVAEALPQNLRYVRTDRDGKLVERDYFEEIRRFQNENPEGCAFRFGTYQEQGQKIALGFWDFSRLGGTLGAEEGSAVAAFFEMAADPKDPLPAVMILNSGGARQQEGTLALLQMELIVAARERFKVPYTYTILADSFGGVNVACGGADGKYIVAEKRGGLTGPAILANILGKDVSQLTSTAHDASEQFWFRNVDLMAKSPRLALEQILYEQSILRGGKLYQPSPELFQTFESSSHLLNRAPNRRYRALIGNVSHFAETILERVRRRGEVFSHPRVLEVDERLAILEDPYRPTFAEFLDPRLKLFDAVSPLSNMVRINEKMQIPPIIGGWVTMHDDKTGEDVLMLAIGQTRQREKTDDGYSSQQVAPRTEDYNWAKEKMELADRLGIPIVVFGDTKGAAADEENERKGIVDSLYRILRIGHTVGVPVYCVLYGENGSGGGLPFARPLNGAAELAYASSFVSDIKAQGFILQNRWPTEQEKIAILRQLRDSRPEVRLEMFFFKKIIPEADGGMQNNPLMTTTAIREFLIEEHRRHKGWTQTQIKDERWDLILKAAQFATVPFPKNGDLSSS